jgi:hypothetical protein
MSLRLPVNLVLLQVLILYLMSILVNAIVRCERERHCIQVRKFFEGRRYNSELALAKTRVAEYMRKFDESNNYLLATARQIYQEILDVIASFPYNVRYLCLHTL